MPRLTREEKLEKKKIAERLRRQKINNDPDLKAQSKVKERERYLKKKRMGKVVPVSQMTPKQQKIARKKSRESSRRYELKKKLARLAIDAEQPISCSGSEAYIDTDCDPLEIPSTSHVTIANSPTTPKTHRNIFTPKRNTRSTWKQTKNMLNKPEDDCLLLETPPISVTVDDYPVTPLNQSKNNIITPDRIIASTSRQSEQSILTQQLEENDSLDNISVDSPIPASTKSDTSNVSSPRMSPICSEIRVKQSAKKTSPWKRLLRKFKYRSQKELQIKDRKIEELKKQNERFKKQLKRLLKDKNNKLQLEKITHKKKNAQLNDKPVPEVNESNKKQIIKTVEDFFEEDDNSRICPGKKEYVTKHKIRKQKRYLTETLQNLHKKFLQNHPNIKISYSSFCKFRPFWVVIPNLNIRETCLCKEHENMDLTVMALRKNGLIDEKSSFEVLKTLCCDPREVKCLTNKCNLCKDRYLTFKTFDNSNKTFYWMWKKNKKVYEKNKEEKFTMQTVKEKVEAQPKDIIDHFENTITSYMNHCANIVSQSNYIKNLKKSLKPEECIIHCDFSENYGIKYASEVQSMHFSRDQVTLHTSVIYYMQNGKLCTQSFCTMSNCLRHDAVAIWEHLLPILNFIEETVPEVYSLYFISDSPSAQYRNRKMFYVIAKLHWYYISLRRVVWNYTEAGHGKGAPDGVGGVLKRTADQIVARGNDIPNMESLLSHLRQNVSNVILKVVEESGIFEKDLLIPANLKEFRGSMNVHQVVWSSSNTNILAMRRLSCDQDSCSSEAIECLHGQHIGFFNLEETHAENVNRNRNESTPKRVATRKTKNASLVKRSKKVELEDHSSKNPLESFNLTESDSFWTEVTSIDERILTPTLTKAVIESLQDKPCEMDSTIKNVEDDDDLNIFD